MKGATFDAGGLIAIERNNRRVLALVARAEENGMTLTIPTTALAQVIRNPARQSRLSRIIRQSKIRLIPLDADDATAVGLLLARTGTRDVVDAHVALCALRAGQAVVTSDPDDIRRIAPDLQLLVV